MTNRIVTTLVQAGLLSGLAVGLQQAQRACKEAPDGGLLRGLIGLRRAGLARFYGWRGMRRERRLDARVRRYLRALHANAPARVFHAWERRSLTEQERARAARLGVDASISREVAR